MSYDFEDPSLPLYPGTLRGYRFWWVHEGRFMSLFKNRHTWWYSTVGKAQCTRPVYLSVKEKLVRRNHDAPRQGCECGIYAWYTPNADIDYRYWINNMFRSVNLVFGVISAWGTIIPGTKGFKAEKAKIEAVMFRRPIPDWSLVTRNYPDVRTFDTEDEMVAAYPPQPYQSSRIETEKSKS